MLNLFQHPWRGFSISRPVSFEGRPWTLKQVGAYRFRIRHPVIASGAKQSRVRANRSGLLRSARNDEVRSLTAAKGIIAKQLPGDEKKRREPTPTHVAVIHGRAPV